MAIVEISGDPHNQEPTHVRIRPPGGEIDVVRVKDGAGADYWVHLHVFHPKSDEVATGDELPSRVTDGRIDLKHKHASECNAGDLTHPDLYHLAVRVTRTKEDT